MTLKQREIHQNPTAQKGLVVNKPPANSLAARQLSNNYLISTEAPTSSSCALRASASALVNAFFKRCRS